MLEEELLDSSYYYRPLPKIYRWQGTVLMSEKLSVPPFLFKIPKYKLVYKAVSNHE